MTDAEIAEVLSRQTGIPVNKMLEGERDKLLKMEEVLHHRVIARLKLSKLSQMQFVVVVPVYQIQIDQSVHSCF